MCDDDDGGGGDDGDDDGAEPGPLLHLQMTGKGNAIAGLFILKSYHSHEHYRECVHAVGGYSVGAKALFGPQCIICMRVGTPLRPFLSFSIS